MALGFGGWNDGGGLYGLVDRRCRPTLLGMNLMKGLIVGLMVVVELGSSARKVFWNHRILLVVVTIISFCTGLEGLADSLVLPDPLSSIYLH